MITFKKSERIRIANIHTTLASLRGKEGFVSSIPRSCWDTVAVIIPNHGLSGFPDDYTWYFSDASERLEKVETTEQRRN